MTKRTRRQDAWIATVRVSIPIDAGDIGSIRRAQESVAKLASLIPGSTVEVTHAGFGRMAAAATESPVQASMADIAQMVLGMSKGPPVAAAYGGAVSTTLGATNHIESVERDDLEPPESLRRVPRPAPNGA